MKPNLVWINDRLVDAKRAHISVSDRGFLYGDGIFETMRSYAGVVFKLDKHIDRLFRSLKVLRIRKPYNRETIKDIVYKCLKANNLKNAYAKIIITRGEGGLGIGYDGVVGPTAIVTTREIREYPAWMHRKGIRAAVIRGIRQNEMSPVSGVKSLNFLGYILARREAIDNKADEAILLNTDGLVTEGATSNIFLVKGNALITPSVNSGILPGITRAVVIDIAERLRLKVKEKRVYYKELFSADEVFLTNSLIEVLPVAAVDSRRIGRGNVGEMTRLLYISYQKAVIREVLCR